MKYNTSTVYNNILNTYIVQFTLYHYKGYIKYNPFCGTV